MAMDFDYLNYVTSTNLGFVLMTQKNRQIDKQIYRLKREHIL